MDTERGLIVPVIREVGRKSLAELAAELPAVAQRARDGKTALKEMQGGTFTITNIGSLGGRSFTALINAPEGAILGMGGSQLAASGAETCRHPGGDHCAALALATHCGLRSSPAGRLRCGALSRHGDPSAGESTYLHAPGVTLGGFLALERELPT